MRWKSLVACLTFSSIAQAAVLPSEGLFKNPSERHVFSRQDDSFDYFVTKGRGYWNDLQAVLKNPNASDIPTVDLRNHWKLDPPKISSGTEATRLAMQEKRLNINQQFFSSSLRFKSHNAIWYKNDVSPSSGIIIAKSNYGEAIDPVTGAVTRAPIRWSNAVLPVWRLACQMKDIDPSALQFISQSTVINDRTIAVLNAAMDTANREKTNGTDLPTFTTWTPEDDEFYAALATPNAVGVLYLLKDYPVTLGWKTIKSIMVYFTGRDKEPNMWFEVEDFCDEGRG